MQQGREQGLQQGLEQGLQQGIKQSKIEIAKKSLEKNLPLETISEITGLSIKEIQELGEQYKLTELLDINGYISRQEILPIMHKSSILLVLTTKSTSNGTHGIMGTKFFENIGGTQNGSC